MAKYAFLFLDEGADPMHTRGHEHQAGEATPTSEQQAVYDAIFKWFEANGPKIVDGGAELQPTRTATTIRKGTGKVTVVDGPFAESKESVGGVSILELPDMASAVELAKTWPGYGVEVRPIVDDHGDGH